MQPWVVRLAPLTAGAPPRPAWALSERELEVAGRGSRAEQQGHRRRAPHLRTHRAEHVQHILTKLGVSNRTEVASWFAGDRR